LGVLQQRQIDQPYTVGELIEHSTGELDGATPQVIQESQRRLNAVYDQFVFRYGPLNAPANVGAMGINPDAFFVRALERWDAESRQRHKTGRPVTEASARQRLKMPLFHEIVVRQARPALSAGIGQGRVPHHTQRTRHARLRPHGRAAWTWQ
jgi:hypothetical protein